MQAASTDTPAWCGYPTLMGPGRGAVLQGCAEAGDKALEETLQTPTLPHKSAMAGLKLLWSPWAPLFWTVHKP